MPARAVSLLLALVAPIAIAESVPVVAVTLVVETDLGDAAGLDPATLSALPGSAFCPVTVAAGASAADVLDQAAEDQCISGWSCDEFGFDCFVSQVDGLAAVGLTCLGWPAVCQWWEFLVADGEEPAATGVRGHLVADGEMLRFLFHTSCTPTLCP